MLGRVKTWVVCATVVRRHSTLWPWIEGVFEHSSICISPSFLPADKTAPKLWENWGKQSSATQRDFHKHSDVVQSATKFIVRNIIQRIRQNIYILYAGGSEFKYWPRIQLFWSRAFLSLPQSRLVIVGITSIRSTSVFSRFPAQHSLIVL
jgi:hypothetical protein